MNDEEVRLILLAKGAEMFGIKPRCEHEQVTLVQHIDPEYGWFAAYQCDECGQMTRREVTADQLLNGEANDLPWLDVDMYEHATKERGSSEATLRALAFIGKAVRR